jgi:predicted dehydrogenase
MDPQEESLKSGTEIKDITGELVLDSGSQSIEMAKGDYSLYYQNIASSILGDEELEVTTKEACFVMELMEICTESDKSGEWRVL